VQRPGARQDVAQTGIDVPGPPRALLRVAEGHLLEPHAVDQMHRRNVQVSGDYSSGAVATMPVVSDSGTAPQCKARIARDLRQVVPQWKVIDQDQRRFSSGLLQACLCVRATAFAPSLPRRIRIRVQA
jgi:hypothetical protein